MSFSNKLVLILVWLGGSCFIAQTNLYDLKGAVYSTVKDFVSNEPTMAVPKKSGHHFKINIANDVITIKKEKVVTKYVPGSVYGYFDGHNKYRYFKSANPLHSGYFKMVELGQIIVYEKLVYYTSKPGPRNSKENRGLVREVFYSMSLDAPIKYLDYKNLITDFKDNSVALHEINSINNSCKTCLTKQESNGYLVNINLNELAKKYPNKFKQSPLEGPPFIVPGTGTKNKGKFIPKPL